MKTPIIFDCDPGHDDAIAMMLALGNIDQLDIKCFSTVGGNQILEKTTNNALRLLELMESDLPVVKGISKPLVKALEIADRIHGESGLDGPVLPQATKKAVDKHILDVYTEILENSDEAVTFVVTGPQSNIALLLVARPDLKAKIKQIVFMGGSCFGGNWTPKAEFNIYVDPEAAYIVAHSGLDLVMCGLDVTHKAKISKEENEQFRNMGNRTARVLAELIDFYSKTAKAPFLNEELGIGIHLHDVTTIAYLLQPEIFTTRDLYVTVDTSDSKYFRGCTIADYNDTLKEKPNMKVCFDINREAFISLLYQSVQKLP